MARRRDVRLIVLDMLEHWGEWERKGLYGAASARSMLGRLVKDGPGTGGGSVGPSLPPGLRIPSDVLVMGRMVNQMRVDHRAGEHYYKAIRVRFVCGGELDHRASNRAIDVLMKIFLRDACISVQNDG